MLNKIRECLLKNNIFIFESDFGKKAVTDSDYKRRQNQIKDISKFKDYANYNIFTGYENIVDVDLDWPEARLVADIFLQPTKIEFGRESTSGRSHRLYKVIDLEKKDTRIFHKFREQKTKSTIVEIRANNHYTMCLGKYDNGEKVIYAKTEEPSEITFLKLKKDVALVALTSVIIRKSKLSSPHNEFYKHIFSIMAMYKVDKIDALKVTEAAIKFSDCVNCKDKDYKTRITQFEKAYERVMKEEETAGLPTLCREFNWKNEEQEDFKKILYSITGRDIFPEFTNEFINKIAYMMRQKKFYDLDDKEMYDAEAIDMKYAKYFPKYTPLKFWKLHKDSKICVDFIYRPDEPKRFIDINKKLYINTYEKNLLLPNSKADTDLFDALVEHVIPHDLYREHFLNWLAYQVQNKGKKIRHAIVLQSDEEQLGKGSLNDIMRDILGKNNSRKIELREALDKSKGYLVNSQLVLIDEAKSKGSWQENSELINTLKVIITEGTIGVRQLYKDYVEQETCTNYWINTNHRDAFAIPKGSPRYWVYFSPAKRNEKLLETFHKERLSGDLAAGVMAQLLDRNLSKFNPSGLAPWTEFAEEMSKQADRPVIDWTRQRFEQGSFPLERDVISTTEFFDYLQNETRIKVTREREVGQALEAIGGSKRKNIQIDGVGNFCTVYIIRNHDKYKNLTAKELSNEYETFRTNS